MAKTIKTSSFMINLSFFITHVEANVIPFFWLLLAAFLNNASIVPVTVDKNEFNDWKLPADQALIWNIGLVLSFGVLHSLMIS
jgi:hypothetical protein